VSPPGKLLKLSFVFSVCFSCCCSAQSQSPGKLRSTFSTGGSTVIFSDGGKYYYIQQSIGQQSVTGISRNRDYLLRQGFIQPPAGAPGKALSDPLKAEISPNPLSDHIFISFPETHDEVIYISVIDLNGKVVFSRKYTGARELDLDLSRLPSSVYILKVYTGSKSFYSRIIKL
jgi:hypothetical protein